MRLDKRHCQCGGGQARDASSRAGGGGCAGGGLAGCALAATPGGGSLQAAPRQRGKMGTGSAAAADAWRCQEDLLHLRGAARAARALHAKSRHRCMPPQGVHHTSETPLGGSLQGTVDRTASVTQGLTCESALGLRQPVPCRCALGAVLPGAEHTEGQKGQGRASSLLLNVARRNLQQQLPVLPLEEPQELAPLHLPRSELLFQLPVFRGLLQ
mmetsp:Transcript_38244/g.83298  ORF Transcript_38244/g.83298 Transcript_38244/m.83298 type:complete len:213 (+) Transcript_38244:858-1496(+)